MKKLFCFLSLAILMAMSVSSCSNGAKAQTYDSYTQEVVKLMNVTNAQQMMKTGIVTMLKSVISENKANTIADEIVADLWDDYLIDCSQVYQKYFTIDELKAVNEFYETPAGAKFAKHTNDIALDIAKIMQEKYNGRIQEIVMRNI